MKQQCILQSISASVSSVLGKAVLGNVLGKATQSFLFLLKNLNSSSSQKDLVTKYIFIQILNSIKRDFKKFSSIIRPKSCQT
jgi:hypothetical protein